MTLIPFGRKMTRGLTSLGVACASLALLGACSPSENEPASSDASAEVSVPHFDMTLKPTLGADGEVDAIEVTSVLYGGLAEGEERLQLSVPVVYVMVAGIAERTLDLAVTDAEGEVALTYEDGEPVPGGFPYFRTFTAARDVNFPVEISYRSLVQPPHTPNGPAFGIRPSAGGVSGSGAGFMLVPTNGAAENSSLHWDLSEFGEDAVGVTTFGTGDVEVEGAPSRLMQAWLMAGPAERYPEGVEDSPFNGFWLGDFPYDEREEMIFVSHMYNYVSTFFTHLDPAPRYTVFMRQLDTPPYGGATALYNSFMLSRGPGREEEFGRRGPRQTFAHEMLHQWVGFLSEDFGEATWFNEGLTTYYEYTLPFRAGEISFEDYVDGLNKLSARFYANPGRDMSAADIVAVGFNDGDIRHVPYVRGGIYFADLDARIRAASNGARSFDDLMERVFRLRESGELELTMQAWAEEVSKETGEDELARINAIHIDGEVFFPAPEAFGSCVTGSRGDILSEGEAFEGMIWRASENASPETCFAVQK